MKGVILAAGDGTRLMPYTGRRPKVLLRVGGRAIIDFTLEAFAQAGIVDAAIVVGYRSGMVKDWVARCPDRGLRIRYLINSDYELGNALSLYAARSFVAEEIFLLAMGDHMVSPEILSRLLEVEEASDTMAVDFAPSPRHVQEATRVLVSQAGTVISIGKGLARYNGIDAGVFLLTPAIFDAIAELKRESTGRCELSPAIARLVERGRPVHACDISGCFWQDIDTLEDLKTARRILARGKDCRENTRA